MTGPSGSGDDGTVAAVLRLADLAGKIERVDSAATRRTDELARDCAAAQDQVDVLCGVLAALTGRAEFSATGTSVSDSTLARRTWRRGRRSGADLGPTASIATVGRCRSEERRWT